MEQIIWFDVCAVILVALLLVLYYKKFSAPFQKYTLFLVLLWLNLISAITSLASFVLPGHAPVWVLRLLNALYFFAHGATPTALFLYVCSLTDYNLTHFHQLSAWLVPSVINTILSVLSIFFDIYFQLDPDGTYHRGPLIFIIYIFTCFHFFAIVYTLIQNHSLIPRLEQLSIHLFLVFMVSAIFIQLLFPNLVIESFICACCLMVSQLTVQNPEQIIDAPTRILNKSGFSYLLVPPLSDRKDFQVGFMILDNYYALEKVLGFDILEQRIQTFADYLRTNTGCLFARVENRRFCFVSQGFRDNGTVDAVLSKLREACTARQAKYPAPARMQFKCGILRCPRDASSFTELMSLLDIAAQASGSENACFTRLDDGDVAKLRRYKQVDQLVQTAVEDGSLYVMYQPIYCTENHRFCSAEALLRMRSKALGEISPAEFIPIAERNGAILKMTQFVLETVCRFLRTSGIQEYGIRRVDINLSTLDCTQTDISQRILNCIRENNLLPSLVSVELTETAFSSLPESINRTLTALSREGVRVLIDDYGTGYSNLSRLTRFPLDIVKIDKSLITDIPGSATARIVLDNTLEMMKRLRKKVLVEGVETQEQLDYLLPRNDCNYIQGYYFAKPMSEEELVALFRDQHSRSCSPSPDAASC